LEWVWHAGPWSLHQGKEWVWSFVAAALRVVETTVAVVGATVADCAATEPSAEDEDLQKYSNFKLVSRCFKRPSIINYSTCHMTGCDLFVREIAWVCRVLFHCFTSARIPWLLVLPLANSPPAF